jgi:hypothetical protein
MPAMTQEDIAVVCDFFQQLGLAAPEVRAAYAEAIGQVRRARFASIADAPTEAAQGVAATLASDGIAELGNLVDQAAAEAMRAHFRPLPIYPGHTQDAVEGPPSDFEAVRRAHHYGCYPLDDIVTCPHFLELANDPHLLQIVEAYLGCPPTIYSLNAWWSFAQSGTPARYSQSLHRDYEDLRFVTLFMYLTPVDDKTGPHRYIRHSHDKAALTRALATLGWELSAIERLIEPLFRGGASYELGNIAERLLGQFATVWTGSPGSAILADTYGLHMGIPPLDGDRLMIWARYGLGAGKFVFDARRHAALVAPRLPQTERARYVNRLMLME